MSARRICGRGSAVRKYRAADKQQVFDCAIHDVNRAAQDDTSFVQTRITLLEM
jgi:hypothetical protein